MFPASLRFGVWLFFGTALRTASGSASSMLLNRWPMLMTHDAGTSYVSGETCSYMHMLNNYMITQKQGPFSSQLDCGARALDLRPYVEKGHLRMHHGPLEVAHDLADALSDIKGWVSQHPGELVLVYTSHFDGWSDADRASCRNMTSAAMADVGIPQLDCGKLASMTVEDAMNQGRLGASGGSVAAISDCVAENYDPSIKCYGDILHDGVDQTNSTADARRLRSLAHPNNTSALGEVPHDGNETNDRFVCYGSGAEKAFAGLWTYMEATCNTQEPPYAEDGQLWMAQAHWQYDPTSISQGEVYHSCIIADESASGVNKKLAEKIRQGAFKHINLLEVDNVCDGGTELLQALQEHAAAAWVADRTELVV